MKRIFILTFVGIVACSLAGFAQTNTPAGDASPASATPAPAQAQPATPPDKAPVAEAPAPAAPQVPANEATPAAAPAAPVVPAAAKATESPVPPGAVVPLIVMDDVPLTDAIRNLARQAGINYVLDPKIGFGQIGADGKTGAQPNVSIRWENVTAEQALTALLNNYNLQLVEDPKSKIARVSVKDPTALPPLKMKIYQLRYAGPSNVLATVQAAIDPKRSRVNADYRTTQLVVTATEQEMLVVDELIQRLDTQTKQVLIETRVLETYMNPTTSKGVDWSGTLAAQNVTMGNNAFTRASGGGGKLDAPIEKGNSSAGVLDTSPKLLMNASSGSFFNPSMAFLNADGVSAILHYLNTYSEVKEISTPRTVTLDNEKAVVEVGELYPIVNVTAGTSQTSGGSQITYSNLTVRLEVTPRISANDYVNLMVTPSITKLGSKYSSTIAGSANEVDSFLTRNLTTHVLIPSGNTLVMGGLIQDQISRENTKVPLLGDIPVLGAVFRSDSKKRKNTDLILFVTPTIVQDQDYQPTKTSYLKRPVPTKDAVEGDWSAWDSGKPKDWSKKQAAAPVTDSSTTETSK